MNNEEVDYNGNEFIIYAITDKENQQIINNEEKFSNCSEKDCGGILELNINLIIKLDKLKYY